MKNKYIRKPDGAWVRKKPGKLKVFLAESVASAPMPQKIYDLAARRSSYGSTGAEPNYSTDAFDISKLKGYEIVQFGAGSGGGFGGRPPIA